VLHYRIGYRLETASPFLFPGANLLEREGLLFARRLRLLPHLPTGIVLESLPHFVSSVYKRTSDIVIHTVCPKGPDTLFCTLG
jgi:hypothetical protein